MGGKNQRFLEDPEAHALTLKCFLFATQQLG